MAWSKKTKTKRNIAQLYFTLDKAMGILLALKERFAEFHEKEADELENAASMILLIQEFIVGFAERHYAFGKDDFEKYL